MAKARGNLGKVRELDANFQQWEDMKRHKWTQNVDKKKKRTEQEKQKMYLGKLEKSGEHSNLVIDVIRNMHGVELTMENNVKERWMDDINRKYMQEDQLWKSDNVVSEREESGKESMVFEEEIRWKSLEVDEIPRSWWNSHRIFKGDWQGNEIISVLCLLI